VEQKDSWHPHWIPCENRIFLWRGVRYIFSPILYQGKIVFSRLPKKFLIISFDENFELFLAGMHSSLARPPSTRFLPAVTFSCHASDATHCNWHANMRRCICNLGQVRTRRGSWPYDQNSNPFSIARKWAPAIFCSHGSVCAVPLTSCHTHGHGYQQATEPPHGSLSLWSAKNNSCTRVNFSSTPAEPKADKFWVLLMFFLALL
jgi:hypothetical protein